MERALLALCALVLNAALAGPRHFYTGLKFAGLARLPAKALRDLERRLNREHRSPSQRAARGWLIGVVLLAASLLAGWILEGLLHRNLAFAELALLAFLLPVRPLWDCAAEIRKSLQSEQLTTAREALEGTVFRHHALLDEHGMARAAIELLAVGAAEKIISPLFWYLLLGLPGLFAAKTLSLFQETAAVSQEFGRAAHRLAAAIHYIPSRLMALLWLAAGLFLPTSPVREAAISIGNRLADDSPHRLALRVAAATLKISLGGPSSPYAAEWLGTGTAKAMPSDIRRALHAFAFLHVLVAVALGLLA